MQRYSIPRVPMRRMANHLGGVRPPLYPFGDTPDEDSILYGVPTRLRSRAVYPLPPNPMRPMLWVARSARRTLPRVSVKNLAGMHTRLTLPEMGGFFYAPTFLEILAPPKTRATPHPPALSFRKSHDDDSRRYQQTWYAYQVRCHWK